VGGGKVIREGANYAGEPLDYLDESSQGLIPMGALVRSVQMAGAMMTILELTASYARDRHQFGVPLVKFQAIQHHLANVAAEVCAAKASVQLAMQRPDEFHIAVAKIRCGEAAGASASLAHQVHGAIGMTDEHRLQQFTRRIWSWRNDFGNEAEWAMRLGSEVLRAGADEVWVLTG
jgi:alkylation response protein AidB-like acyl-CoA dehydrogenase